MISNLAADVDAFTSNAFLVAGERTVLVDAGSGFDVVGAIEERAGSIDAVVLTHAHPDHVGTVPALREAFDVEVWGFGGGVRDLGAGGRDAGAEDELVDRELDDGETVRIGDHQYRALHTPGHAPDHLCFYAPEPSILFAGDLVFADGGFGRTDLPGGDRATLLDSIERVLEAVDGDLAALHTGHGRSVEGRAHDHLELAARAARGR